ncbi:DUF1345 domain-containing protein [Brachybacterium halotolerans subsp. kimchii]|uniref:DUF1345 domain-containing protein n=1 Tax=Brachybacterium halotolerans TaxID=2795215 RepID=UPI001E43C871|nr:DUF1345 domain-containing protein [Brachybacterium halotolerans]UEJ81358.1 DUF1345 domain-containing protein [Brachybacterium halotolerans subsp. kimchii]
MTRLKDSTRLRLLLAIVVGGALGVLLWLATDRVHATMIAITVGETVFLVTSWLSLWPMDAEQTRRSVGREDLRPSADEALTAGASALAVITVVALHLGAAGPSGASTMGAIITLVGVFGAWACVHQTYAVHYAHRYYATGGGLDFGDDEPPAYSDFLYVAYAVGMTYGVTDTGAVDRGMRKIVLRHGLVSFVFGLVILGAAVNLVAGVFGLG